jgi:glycosyltransferase involved in cell wall biosynthesis
LLNNIHIYPSIFKHETRILKIIRSLKNHSVFENIVVIALWKDGMLRSESLSDGIEVIRVSPIFATSMSGRWGRIFRVIGWYLAVLIALRMRDIKCVNCHSLPVLPLSVMIKIWKRCKLVYEPHELETEKALASREAKIFLRVFERLFIRFADAVCLVNESIAQWYKLTYKLKVTWVVKNIPYTPEKAPIRTGKLRKSLGLSDDCGKIFLYQGGFVPSRGVNLLIDVFSTLPSDHHLIFMGYGELEGVIQEAVSDNSNIHFMPAVHPDELLSYTADADVGLALIENACLSYYLSLPNKLFEYAACGVPVLVSNFPEMSSFIDSYDCGWKVDPNANALRELIIDVLPTEIEKKRINAQNSSQFNSWQQEEKILIEMNKVLGFYGALN